MTNEEVMVVSRALANAVAACSGNGPITDEEWEKGQKKSDFEEMRMVARECITALDMYRQSRDGRQIDCQSPNLIYATGVQPIAVESPIGRQLDQTDAD